jgi:hypothetical protein
VAVPDVIAPDRVTVVFVTFDEPATFETTGGVGVGVGVGHPKVVNVSVDVNVELTALVAYDRK